MRLKGRTAIVSGAGRGIGRHAALLLAEQGAKVWVIDPGVGRGGEDTQERPADEVVAEIRSNGGQAEPCYDSVADHAKMGSLVDGIVESHGKLDILINVAGILRERMIWNMTEDEFDAVIAVHLKGHWNLSHHALRHMRKANYGRIVNFASNAFKGSVGQANYSAAKGGIISLTRSIAKETQKYNITCNVICPSADTRMTMNEAVAANRKRKLEAGLITQAQYDRSVMPRGPEYIAPLVAYLAGENAWRVSGELFHAERGRITSLAFGEERRMIIHPDNEMFTAEQLDETVEDALLAGFDMVVPKADPNIQNDEERATA